MEEDTVIHTDRAVAAARIRRQLAPLVAAPLAQHTTTQLQTALTDLAGDLAMLNPEGNPA